MLQPWFEFPINETLVTYFISSENWEVGAQLKVPIYSLLTLYILVSTYLQIWCPVFQEPEVYRHQSSNIQSWRLQSSSLTQQRVGLSEFTNDSSSCVSHKSLLPLCYVDLLFPRWTYQLKLCLYLESFRLAWNKNLKFW